MIGQGRLDGAFCEYTEADKMDYLNQIRNQGVVNIEMEAIPFAALSHHAGIKSAIVCVALLDRLKGDQVIVNCVYCTTYLYREIRITMCIEKRCFF